MTAGTPAPHAAAGGDRLGPLAARTSAAVREARLSREAARLARERAREMLREDAARRVRMRAAAALARR